MIQQDQAGQLGRAIGAAATAAGIQLSTPDEPLLCELLAGCHALNVDVHSLTPQPTTA